MENASKALIIAGAILLSIIIISLGLVVVNNVRDTISGNNLSAEQKQAFNSKLDVYEGNNVSGIQVNALIDQVIQLNTEAVRNNTGTFVGIAFPTATDLTGNTMLEVKADLVNAPTNVVAVAEYAKDARDTLSEVDYKVTISYTKSTKLTRVASGKTYQVTMSMTDGVISKILVLPN